jgi:hypothetical protein
MIVVRGCVHDWRSLTQSYGVDLAFHLYHSILAAKDIDDLIELSVFDDKVLLVLVMFLQEV